MFNCAESKSTKIPTSWGPGMVVGDSQNSKEKGLFVNWSVWMKNETCCSQDGNLSTVYILCNIQGFAIVPLGAAGQGWDILVHFSSFLCESVHLHLGSFVTCL